MNTARSSGRRAAREPGTEAVTGSLPWDEVDQAVAQVEAGTSHPTEVVRGDGQRVGLVSQDSALCDLVAGICASAGASLRISAVDTAMSDVDIQLCDIQALTDGVGRGPGAAAQVVLLGRPEDAGLWDAAALLGGCPVAVLPAAESWLADRLAPPSSMGEHEPAVVVGVAGAVGGTGTSTLACWLAADAAASGARSALVDADPDGCGLDVLLGLESVETLRWPDLCRSRGALRPEQLWPLLPGHVDHENLHWLSWGRDPETADPVLSVSVLAALRMAAQAVVVDLGRIRAGESALLAAQCDVVVLTMPRTVRGVLAAHRATGLLDPSPVEYALCGVDVADVDDALVADALGRAPLGHIRFDGRVPEAAETGRLLERGTRRPHAQSVSELWDGLTRVVGPRLTARGGGF